MRTQILEKIKQHKIKTVVLEEVPMQRNSNLRVAHDLCVGQGMICGLCCEYKLIFSLYLPTEWRSIMELYDGTKNSTKRDYQKQAAVNLVNKLYEYDFQYYKSDTKKHQTDDDKAEAILLGLAYIKENSDE